MSLIRKTMVLSAGTGAARILGTVTAILLARVLGVERFGVLGYAMSVALMLEVLIDMGQQANIGRLVAQDHEDGPGIFAYLGMNTVTASLVLAVAVTAVVRLTGASMEEAATVGLMTLWAGFLCTLNGLRSIARSLGRFAADSVTNGLEGAGRFAVVLVAWAFGAGLVGYAAAFAVESAVAALAFFFFLRRDVHLAPKRFEIPESLRFFRRSMPLGIAAVGMIGFYNVDQVFVRVIAGAEANGLYAAATKVAFAASVLGGLVVIAAYPDLARTRDDFDEFKRHMRATLRVAVSLCAGIAVVVFVLAGPAVTFLYGAEYAETTDLLRVLSIVILFNGLTLTGVYAANALGRERRVMVVVLTFVALNAIFNATLIPTYGAVAAAWTSAVGEVGVALSLLALSRDRLFGHAPALKGAGR